MALTQTIPGRLECRFLRRNSNWDEEVLCSEFVLESLAFGGQVMVDEFEGLSFGRDGIGRFFYPADFARSDRFRTIELQYFDYQG